MCVYFTSNVFIFVEYVCCTIYGLLYVQVQRIYTYYVGLYLLKKLCGQQFKILQNLISVVFIIYL